MCTVSNIGDMYGRTFPRDWPNWIPHVEPAPQPEPMDLAKLARLIQPNEAVTREEFNALKAELESLKKLLMAAKKFDEETGQRDCEQADKIALFKKLAELVGIDMTEVFK